MNPTLLLASIAAAIIGSAQAGYVYIYSPYAATKCQPGTPCAIAWHVSHDGPEFERIDIELLSGEAHNASVVAPIVLGYDLSQGNTFLWNVPQGFIPEGDYFIRIKGVGTDYQSYSHSFPVGFGPQPIPTVVPTITPTTIPTSTPTGSTTGLVTPTRTGSALSSISSIKKSSTAAASTSTSSAMSVQGSVSVAAAVIAAAFAIMMF